MESSNNDSFDGENADTEFDCDVWSNINKKIEDEIFSAAARTNTGLGVVLNFVRCGIAWHHDMIYKAIMESLRKAQVSKDMSFQKALKFAIQKISFEIRKKLALTAAEAENSESDDEDEESN